MQIVGHWPDLLECSSRYLNIFNDADSKASTGAAEPLPDPPGAFATAAAMGGGGEIL